MNIYEKIERISSAPSCCGRLKSEMRFASRISKELDGKFDRVVNEAADFIISALEKSNYITEELTHSAEEKLAVLTRHLHALAQMKGEAVAVREMRRHIVCYVRGMRDAARLRVKVNAITEIDEMEAALTAFMLEGKA